MAKNNWTLPTKVNINGKDFAIRERCNYSVVLDVISVLNDDELDDRQKMFCALFIFYEKSNEIKDTKTAITEMFKIINVGEIEEESEKEEKPKLLDWEYDFSQLAPPISRVLGYSLRDENNFTHWWDFVGAFHEIGECTFNTIASIRSKRAKGKKLDNWEQEFYRDNKKLIDLPKKLTAEETEWLSDDW